MCDYPANFRSAPQVNRKIHPLPDVNKQPTLHYQYAYDSSYQKGYNRELVQIPVRYGLGWRLENVNPIENCNPDQQIKNYEDYKKNGNYGCSGCTH